MKRFLAVFLARNLEFFRDRGTLLWNIFFPLLLIFGFAFAFSGRNSILYRVGTVGEPDKKIEFLNYKHMLFLNYDSPDEAVKKLYQHKIDLVLDFREKKYYINTDDPGGYIAEKMLIAGNETLFSREYITGKAVRYIDWFVPGVIALNIMFSCLMGVGFVITRYRKNGVLKRFKATPLHAYEFIIAQLFSRFFIIAFMTFIIYTGTNFFLHFKMEGSYFNLIMITSAAILCHISLGLLFSTRIKSEELAGGLINIVIWPMMFLSGIFFSLEGTPQIMQTASRIFPVTYFLESARMIMLEGAGFFEVLKNLVIMTSMTVFFLIISSLIFKWE